MREREFILNHSLFHYHYTCTLQQMLGNDAAAADDGLYMAELMYSEQEKRSRVVHTL